LIRPANRARARATTGLRPIYSPRASRPIWPFCATCSGAPSWATTRPPRSSASRPAPTAVGSPAANPIPLPSNSSRSSPATCRGAAGMAGSSTRGCCSRRATPAAASHPVSSSRWSSTASSW